MITSSFDQRLEGAMAALYQGYAISKGKWNDQTRFNAKLLKTVISGEITFHAQLLQDAFVLATTDHMRNGQFVEIGVGDGTYLSNTVTLERDFDWKGLLIEPNPFFWPKIEASRPDAALAKVAVLAAARDPLSFRHVDGFPEISALDDFAEGDGHDRSQFTPVRVEVAAVADVFRTHDIAAAVDYVSIDVEGPEIEILGAILEAGFRPRILTIEHNRVPERIKALHETLRADYEVVLPGASNWDLWAVEKSFWAKTKAAPR